MLILLCLQLLNENSSYCGGCEIINWQYNNRHTEKSMSLNVIVDSYLKFINVEGYPQQNHSKSQQKQTKTYKNKETNKKQTIRIKYKINQKQEDYNNNMETCKAQESVKTAAQDKGKQVNEVKEQRKDIEKVLEVQVVEGFVKQWKTKEFFPFA